MQAQKSSNSQIDKEILDCLKRMMLAEFCYQNDMVQEFIQITHNETYYQLGDSIQCTQMRNNKQERVFGKIINIVALLIKPAILPKVQIQEYIQKSQFQYRQFELTKHDYEGMSEFELILDDKRSWIFFSDVEKLIKVMGLKDFEQANITQDQYFTRATFQEGQLLVDEVGWCFVCICRQLSNPDKSYVQCNRCQIWMHEDCAKIDIQDFIANHKNFLCSQCKRVIKFRENRLKQEEIQKKQNDI